MEGQVRPDERALRAQFARLILIAIALCGCGAADTGGPSRAQAVQAPLWQADVTKCEGVLPPLPEPEVWKVPRALTPEQGRRQAEADDFVARQYCARSFRIVRITQDEYGNINDWLAPADFAASHPLAPLPRLTPV